MIAQALKTNGQAYTHQDLLEGISFEEVELLRKNLCLTQTELAPLLGITPSKLTRFKKKAALEYPASDQFYRLATIYVHALSLMNNDSSAAVRWLKADRKILEGKNALEWVNTTIGFEDIIHYIHRIEHGIPN